MIKTTIFTKVSELNKWIEEREAAHVYFKINQIQYRPVVFNNGVSDRIFVVYSERTEKEEESLVKAFSEAMFGKESKND